MSAPYYFMFDNHTFLCCDTVEEALDFIETGGDHFKDVAILGYDYNNHRKTIQRPYTENVDEFASRCRDFLKTANREMAASCLYPYTGVMP